jgi:hypothetical protein
MQVHQLEGVGNSELPVTLEVVFHLLRHVKQLLSSLVLELVTVELDPFLGPKLREPIPSSLLPLRYLSASRFRRLDARSE